MLPLILLHGALGSARQLLPLHQQLSQIGEVHTLEFSAHGHTPPAGAFNIKSFAEEVIAYMSVNQLLLVNIFGYSMGGYVALYLARHHPEKVARIVTLGTKLQWDPDTSAKEVANLNPEKIRLKVPQFAASLEDRHRAIPWPELMQRTATMMQEMGHTPPLSPSDFKAILTPVRLLLGDRDKMVTIDETIAVYKDIAGAEFGIVPGTPHPIEGADTPLLASLITSFFTKAA